MQFYEIQDCVLMEVKYVDYGLVIREKTPVYLYWALLEEIERPAFTDTTTFPIEIQALGEGGYLIKSLFELDNSLTICD